VDGEQKGIGGKGRAESRKRGRGRRWEGREGDTWEGRGNGVRWDIGERKKGARWVVVRGKREGQG
jgi:hypothetical protein